MAAPSDRDYWNHNTAYHPWPVCALATQFGALAIAMDVNAVVGTHHGFSAS